MNSVEILRVLEDWNPWKAPWDEGIIRPFYLERLKKQARSGHVLVITGARRSGKSFLMKQLASALIREGADTKDILFINFEDPRWLVRDARLLDDIFSTYRESLCPTGKPFVFLDEVQTVLGWERWVRTRHELGQATMILSGSNAALLGRELGTVLTGRHVDTVVYPLSFREFLEFRGIPESDSIPSATLEKQFRDYCFQGSFPALAGRSEEPNDWFLAFYDDVVEKDLVKRFKIRKVEELKALLNFALSNISKPITALSVSKFLKLSPETVAKFLAYFEQAYLLFSLTRFSRGMKEREKSPRKLYCIDTALARMVGFRTSEDFGRMAENIVFLEYRRRLSRHAGSTLFSWKDTQAGVGGPEVDFVVQNGERIEEIAQVSMGDLVGDTRKRELRALTQAARRLHPERALVITETEEGTETLPFGTVSFVPLQKWLLAPEGAGSADRSPS